jgi:[1-hydroxy-2-(trimethylamino)ethyl]phosphonate dioxygenase
MPAGLWEEIERLFGEHGAMSYFGERVSLTEHCLQTAHFIERQGGSPTLVAAALLHDVGHLLEVVPADIEDWHTDAEHERVGAEWVAVRLGSEAAEPVRLHVAAKRYLCATEPAYLARLSAASRHTLELQGGPMSAAEAARFAALPGALEAVQLRRCDDQGKVAGLLVPPLEAYRTTISRAASSARPIAGRR